MRKIRQLRSALSKRTRWVLCLLVATSGLLVGVTVSGIGTSAQGSLNAGTSHATTSKKNSTTSKTSSPKSVDANTVAKSASLTVKNYDGGHMLAADPNGGYWTTNWDGAIVSHDGAPLFGSPAFFGVRLSKPIVDLASTPDGQGYWAVGSDGGIFTYGDAQFYGSTGAMHLNQPIVGMSATPDGKGYWLVASDGGIFTFGDGQFYGSTGAKRLNQPIVGMAETPNGQGYWLVANDGGVFAFGDAQFLGTLRTLSSGVVGLIVTSATSSYSLVKVDGSDNTPTLTPVAAPSAPSAPPSKTSTTTPSKTTTTTPSKTTTTTTPGKTTTTPPPEASGNGTLPDAPVSLGAPTTLALDDEFNTGSLNTSLWSPDWFGNGGVTNGTVMNSDNVSVDGNGLELKLAADSTGGLVSSDPSDGQPGHTGFQIAPTPGHPVYVEYKATLPTTAGQIANWPALWLTGQQWPLTGEIDVMEGFGQAYYHIEYGPAGSDPGVPGYANPGGVGGTTGGTHTFGVLWSTTGVTFVYDGAVVGSETASMTSPMYLVMENSLASGGPPLLNATMTVRYVRVWH